MNETKHNDESAAEAKLAPASEPPPASAIEGEVVEPAAEETMAPPYEPASPERPLEFAQYAAPPKPLASILAGAVAGALVSAGLLWYFLPDSNVQTGVAQRLAALEGSAGGASGAEKRVGALEDGARLLSEKMAGVMAFGPRLSALEAVAPDVKTAIETSKSALSAAQAAQTDAAKALQAGSAVPATAAAPGVDAGVLDARIGKLEAGVAAALAAQPDLAPVNERLAKLEAALASPKSEARVASEPAPPSRDDAAALAVVAQALGARIEAGQPYPLELAALERLGADPQRLAQLKPFAKDGAPSLAALSSDFARITPALLSAAEPKGDDGVMARLMNNMSKIVRVHPVGEQSGDDPAAVASQVMAALARGDTPGALSAFERLPAAARQIGKDWADKAHGRLAAAMAAQALLDDSIGRLGAAKN
jgi:hypothetical protein